MGDTEEFNTLTFEKKLMQLKDTQESIQGMSSWCLNQRAHHKKIVSSWLNVLKRVKVEQRLVLFYLANDVIQYSKRKNYDFVESWGLNLQKATPLVRDEKVRPKILRIFKIWEQRSVYDDEFLSDLTGLLSAGAVKKTDDDPLDFQPQQLVNKIKQCQVLESDTDQKLKLIHEHPLPLDDPEALAATLKERCLKDDVEKELTEGVACAERYTQALQREIVARETLLALLTSANQYYSTQRGEVKVVAYAYKNFGARVRALKRKLDELIPTLPSAVPSPPALDEEVPSPGPDEDIDLPNQIDNTEGDDMFRTSRRKSRPALVAYNIDRTFNTSLAADGSLYNLGLSSFLTSDNPMSLFNDSIDNLSSSNKIEVINSRPNEKQDFNLLNDFLKNLTGDSNPATSDNNSEVPKSSKTPQPRLIPPCWPNAVASGTLSQKSQDALPGLDLLTPESTGNPPPPTSFYGTMEQINGNQIPTQITDQTKVLGNSTPTSDEPEQPYIPETPSPWTTNNWTVPTAVPPPPTLPVALSGRFIDTPESPPPAPAPTPVEPIRYTPETPAVDVDHRGLLPPPPPPPVLPLLGHVEDVDHRMLPNLPPMPTIISTPIRHSVQSQDVDHRNLISLTQPPAPVPRPMNPPLSVDQDYRVPPVIGPSDIVESVDMDLSEDEDQQGMYPQNQADLQRRSSFNNNKVLVGGDNGKTVHDNNNTNVRQDRNMEKKESHSAPVITQMVNPFDAMPPSLQRLTKSYNDSPEENEFEGDLMNRSMSNDVPPEEFQDDWNRNRQQFNHRFPRNWNPRNNFMPQNFGSQQFWPRNGPRPPNRWPGPRPQRFW